MLLLAPSSCMNLFLNSNDSILRAQPTVVKSKPVADDVNLFQITLKKKNVSSVSLVMR